MTLTAPERLRAAALRVTSPRTTVLQVLDDAQLRHEHLPVAELATRVRAVLGSVSTQAVYDCLEALAAAGLARRIEPAGHPVRYESRVGDNHHHLVCRECDATFDVDCAVGAAPCLTPGSLVTGFAVDEAEVVFWGLCAQCAAAGELPPPAPPRERSSHHRRGQPRLRGQR